MSWPNIQTNIAPGPLGITGASASVSAAATGLVCRLGGTGSGGQLKRWSILLDATQVTTAAITIAIATWNSLTSLWVPFSFLYGSLNGAFGALSVTNGTATYIAGNAPTEGLQVSIGVASTGTFAAVILAGS